jgi:hypothetical protein
MAGGQGGKRDNSGGLGHGGVTHVLHQRSQSSANCSCESSIAAQGSPIKGHYRLFQGRLIS